MIEMGTVKKAQKALQEAGQDIQHAQQLVPAIPYIDPADLKAAMSGVMLNALLMPGVFGDMMQQAKVSKAKKDVERMTSQVSQAKTWCVNNGDAAKTEAAALQAALQVKGMQI